MTNFHKGCLAILLLASLFLYLHNNDFPLGYHPDEVKKVAFIQSGSQDFYHPILLLQSVRSLNAFLHFNDPQQIAEVGRLVSALAGVAITATSFFIAKRLMPPAWALLAATMTASCPLIAIHAHYLKEDLLFTSFALLSLLQLLRTLDTPKFSQFSLLGLLCGLSAATKYVGILLLLLSIIATFILPKELRRKAIFGSILSVIIAAATFIAINYPLLFDPNLFANGVGYELNHAIKGHDYLAPIPITPFDFWFGFHFLYSIIPGIGYAAAIMGAFYTLSVFIAWNRSSNDEKIIALYIIIFYFIPELSPLKPFPDFMRYMIPAAPPLILFSCQACRSLFNNKKIVPALILTSFFIALACYHAWYTISLVNGISSDTRDLSTVWMQEHQGEFLAERYTGKEQSDRKRTLADTDLERAREQGIKYLILSSFISDRFNFAKKLPHHAPAIDNILNDYNNLLSFPHLVITPNSPSYAFINPTITIIDISQHQ